MAGADMDGIRRQFILGIGGTLIVVQLIFLGSRLCSMDWKATRHSWSSLWQAFCKWLTEKVDTSDPVAIRVEKELQLWHVALAQRTTRYMNCFMGIACCTIVLDTLRNVPRTMTFEQELIFFICFILTQFTDSFPWLMSSRLRHLWYSIAMAILILNVCPLITQTRALERFMTVIIVPQLVLGLISLNMGLVTFWNLVLTIVLSPSITSIVTNDGATCFSSGFVFTRMLVNTTMVLLVLGGMSSWINTDVRCKIDQMVLTSEWSAARALLDTVCDVVLELDSTLTISEEVPQLSHLLLRSGRSFQGQQLQTFMLEDDHQHYVNAMQQTSLDMPARALHVRMRDGDGNKLSMELFTVHFGGLDELPRYLLGMREFTDLPPLAGIPEATERTVSAEAAAVAIMQRQQIRGQSQSSERVLVGTPREMERNDFDGLAEDAPRSSASTPSSSNRSSRRRSPSQGEAPCLRDGLRETREQSKLFTMLNLLSTWNVRVGPIQCCQRHCLIHEARHVLKRMQRARCSEVPCNLEWQCQACGILDSDALVDGACTYCREYLTDAAEEEQFAEGMQGSVKL